MKYQTTSYSCGAAAVVNALRCYGKKVPERIVKKLAFTDPQKGTDEHGIISALRNSGVDGGSFEYGNEDDALAHLVSALKKGDPSIICTQNFQHWVTVVGLLGDRFVVFDPIKTKSNMRENGVHVYASSTLLKTWQSRDGKLFGVTCFKK